MRWAAPLLLACCLLATACTQREHGPAVERILVTGDGFHAAVLIEHDDGYEEWGFGDRAWLLAEDTSCLRAMRLAIIPGEQGAVYRRTVPIGRAQRATGGFTVALDVDAEGASGLRQALAAWISGPAEPVGDGTVIYPSDRQWVGWNTCADAVACWLRGAGYDLPGTAIRGQTELARDIHAALANRRRLPRDGGR